MGPSSPNSAMAQTPGPCVTLKVNPEPSAFILLLNSQLLMCHHPLVLLWLLGPARHAGEVEVLPVGCAQGADALAIVTSPSLPSEAAGTAGL